MPDIAGQLTISLIFDQPLTAGFFLAKSRQSGFSKYRFLNKAFIAAPNKGTH
jgi:hypothetical protein